MRLYIFLFKQGFILVIFKYNTEIFSVFNLVGKLNILVPIFLTLLDILINIWSIQFFVCFEL